MSDSKDLWNRRILILDDEEEIRNGFSDILVSGRIAQPTARKSSRVKKNSDNAGGDSSRKGRENFEIFICSTGEEAVETVRVQIAKQEPIAAGFFDVRLGGGIDGIETVRRIWEIDDSLLCTIVTAYQDRDVDDIASLFNVETNDQWDYLNKPFTEGEIRQRARSMVASWNRRKNEKEYAQKLLEMEKLAAVGTVARGTGHELGNIMFAMSGQLDIARRMKTLEDVYECFDNMKLPIERANAIARNFLALSKDKVYSMEEFALREAVEDAKALVNHEFIKASIEFDIRIDPSLMVKGDRIMLSQVFLNMAINAMHAIAEKGDGKGEFAIQASVSDGRCLVVISDNGCGIGAGSIKHVFKPLYTSKGAKGSGIGLSISKEIIEKHGGLISVESQPGKGTEFRITLGMK